MKPQLFESLTVVFLAVALPLLASCSSTQTAQSTTEKSGVEVYNSANYKEGAPGGTLTETFKFTGTIAQIDPVARSVTVVAPDGTHDTFKAEPQSATFARLVTGQQVKVSVVREQIIFLGKEGPPAKEGSTAAAALAAKEGTSDVFVTKWQQRDAVVAGMEFNKRLVVLRFSDGTSKMFPVRKDVDMKRAKIGDDIVILIGSAATFSFE